MPQYYRYAGQPRQYNAAARMVQPARAAETRGLGDRYTGPVPPSDLGPVPASMGNSLGSYFGGQDLGGSLGSYFGGQRKGLGNQGELGMLSDNEKRLVSIGAIGIVGWFFFGKKIKKALK